MKNIINIIFDAYSFNKDWWGKSINSGFLGKLFNIFFVIKKGEYYWLQRLSQLLHVNTEWPLIFLVVFMANKFNLA